jgi:hypothetical protein
MKLNIGCGTDYREGFVNIDGSKTLPRVDKVIDISIESLTAHFNKEEFDYILAQDILEHHYHWEAVRIMSEMYGILKKGGEVEIRVPDCEYIIRNWRMPIKSKLTYLFGGQDIPQGLDAEMDVSRKSYPQYFCHKFGWTRTLMTEELLRIGFVSVRCERAETNFIAYASK